MTIEEAIRILDPETSKEALQPYAYDSHQRRKVVDEACRVAVAELNKRQWISVKVRLPKAEEEVLVAVFHKCSSSVPVITTAIYEDGTVLNEESIWNWFDVDFIYDNNENELVPQGWWEYRHYNPDEVYNNCIDGVVTHWQPLPGGVDATFR